MVCRFGTTANELNEPLDQSRFGTDDSCMVLVNIAFRAECPQMTRRLSCAVAGNNLHQPLLQHSLPAQGVCPTLRQLCLRLGHTQVSYILFRQPFHRYIIAHRDNL